MELLWEAGANVRAYDPQAMDETRRIYPDQPGLELCDNAHDALKGADALAIVTEWQEFRSPDFDEIRDKLRHPAIFDGRNLYQRARMEELGYTYYSVGRSPVKSA